MATEKEKPAVPVPPAPTDGEQPLPKSSEQSITEEIPENNPPEKNYEEKLRMLQRMNNPAYLYTVSMNELYENVFQSKPPIIDEILITWLSYSIFFCKSIITNAIPVPI
jgi:hypothetical protein